MNDTGADGSGGATRSPAEIERELEQARRRLATNLDQLTERLSPKAIASRSADKAKLQVMEPSGELRTNRVAALGAAAAAIVALVVWRRRR